MHTYEVSRLTNRELGLSEKAALPSFGGQIAVTPRELPHE
jgi:hypothetical protein